MLYVAVYADSAAMYHPAYAGRRRGLNQLTDRRCVHRDIG
jgi:hypothetical protein